MKLLLSTFCVVLVCGCFCRGYAQTAQVSPVSKADSIPGNLNRQLSGKEAQLKRLVPGDSMALKQVRQAGQQLGLGGQQLGQSGKQLQQAGKQQLDSVLGIVKSPLTQLAQPVKIFEGQKAVTVGQLSVDGEYTYFRDTAGLGLGAFSGMMGVTGYGVNYGVTLGGLPFNANVMEANGINTLNYTPFQNFYQFNFNHEQYLQDLRNRLLAKLSPEALMNSALSRVNVIKNNYETELRGEVTSVQQEYAKTYKSTLTLPPNATNLSASDMAALRTQLMPGDSIRKYQKDLEKLQAMTVKNQGQPPVHDSTYQATLASTKRYEATEKIYGRIVAYRKKFTDNPVVKQLLATSTFTPGAMKAYLSNPANLSQVLDDQTSMSMIQRLMVNMQQLNLGQNAVNTGELNVQNLVNTGASAQFQNSTTSVGMITGQNNNVNNWQAAGLTSQTTNEYSNLTGFKLGTGSGSKLDQSISFDMFHMNNATTMGQSGASYMPVAPFSDGAISLHTGFELAPKQLVTLDLSKSFGQYQQTGGAQVNGGTELPTGSVFNGAGKSNYAGILDYTGELFKTDVKLYLKKVGLGYYNPGNALLHSGETEYGLGLSRRFLNKLTFKYDGDYRRQVYDPGGNYVYTSLDNKLQVGYKIDRNDKVNLTYQRSNYQSDFYGQAPVYGFTSRLQMDGSYRFMVEGKRVTNNLTVSETQTSIPLTTGGSYVDNALLITNTSTILVKRNPLSLTILSNTSSNTSYLFNTSMFTSEANYGYTIPGWPRMSSALGYYANAGWNKQIGMRQQVSAVVARKVTMDVMVSYRKAVQIIQAALANQLFVNATAHYTFK